MNLLNKLLFITVTLLLNACGGTSENKEPTAPLEKLNSPPELTPLTNLVINENEQIELIAHASDKDNDPLVYQWQQISGPQVTIFNSTTHKTNFTAPNLALSDGSQVIKLAININDGHNPVVSQSIEIEVKPVAKLPEIETSYLTSTFLSQQVVTINCNVHDSDGNITKFELFQNEGPNIEPIETNACPLKFSLPSVNTTKNILLTLSITDDDNLTQTSDFEIKVIKLPLLNDTGINLCNDYANDGSKLASNSLDCNLPKDADGDPIPQGQDGHKGISNLQYQNNMGSSFLFIKISKDGDELPDNAQDWSCIKDKITNLIWEAKTNDGGIHDKDNTYSWYQPDNNLNAGIAGNINGGECMSSSCDTFHFIKDVNNENYCGVSNWRSPTPQELISIIDFSKQDIAVNLDYFKNNGVHNSTYWSSTPVPPTEYFSGFIKVVNTTNGSVFFSSTTSVHPIRLVATH